MNLTNFEGRGEESGGGINSQNFWYVDTEFPFARASTNHGPFATLEAAEVKARVYSQFEPLSSEATATWDVSWNGELLSALGADSSAQARVTLRVYEVTPGNRAGPTVFERTVVDDGIGSALRALSTLTMKGSDNQSVALPPLDLDKVYRLEAEIHCSTRVAFSLNHTACGFGGIAGLHVASWSIRFDNVPAS
ncbi:MAG: hypothetical protein ACXIVQ_09320 [Acidimicrobiales bacterium]